MGGGQALDNTWITWIVDVTIYCSIFQKQFSISPPTSPVFRHKIRGGVENTRLEAEAKDTKKNPRPRAKDSLSEDRPSRGQGQECSRPRPRTKDTGASVLQKKKMFKNFFQAISNSLAYPEFLIVGGLNYKSHEMTSSKFFQRGSFCGTKISCSGSSEIVVACLHVSRILERKRA